MTGTTKADTQKQQATTPPEEKFNFQEVERNEFNRLDKNVEINSQLGRAWCRARRSNAFFFLGSPTTDIHELKFYDEDEKGLQVCHLEYCVAVLREDDNESVDFFDGQGNKFLTESGLD